MTATREARFAKICARDAGFFACLSGIREIVTTQINVLEAKANQPGECKISVERANLHLIFSELLQKLVVFKCIFWERKNEIRESDEKSAGCGILVILVKKE